MAGMEKVQAALNKFKLDKPGVAPPPSVTDRVDRGRERMRRDASFLEMCWRFWRGDTYCWLDSKSQIHFSPTSTSVKGGGKEPHRVRQSLSILQPIVRHEVSAATQRVPGYEISPSSMDPDDQSAASLAKRVSFYLYDHCNIRRVTQQVVTYSVVADMGFAWPYWDAYKGKGDICIKTFGLNECYWEPGIRFEDSLWHCVEQGMTTQDAMSIDGYLGGTVVPDAGSSVYSERNRMDLQRTLVTVTEYLERPSKAFPEGRWLTLANGRVIAGVREDGFRPYPSTGDDPCIIPLSYVEDPDSDRNQGLVRHMLDLVRTAQDSWSKALEWKNRALNPQWSVPVGSMKGRRTDAPGALNFFVPVGGMRPEPEKVPPIPRELFEIIDRAQALAGGIAAQNEIPNQVEAGKAIQALIERDATARQAFLSSLAEFHSRLMRRCLELAQEYYTDAQTLAIRGHSGWEPIKDFKGAKLRDQIDVRVSAGSLVPMTREAIQGKIATIVQLFPGYLSPEAAITAMENGTGEEIIQDYENHVARANRIIQRVKDGTLMEMPMVPNPRGMQPAAPQMDPATGMMTQPAPEPEEVPGWMPRPFDRTEIHKHVFETFMTSEEWEQLTPDRQHAALVYYDALLKIEADQQAQELAAQSQMAAGLGAQNAARPGLNPMPSLPGGQSQPGGSPTKT